MPPRDIRYNEPVQVRRPHAHPHPVYFFKQRAKEIGDEPVTIRWNGYYKQLEREGAIEVVNASQVEVAE
jgi:hypothetical protein